MEPREKRLRIAVQSKGRLAEASLQLIEQTGLRFRRGKDDLLLRVEDAPIDVLRVRDDDIANFVAKGVCDLGIVGRNALEEARLTDRIDAPDVIAELGFGRCALKIAVPENVEYGGLRDLEGARIASSHPGILRRYLDEKGVRAEIVEMSGSVEVAPRLHIATAICDLVSTGATLDANGLRAVETVLDSEAVLVQGGWPLNDRLLEVRARFLTRVDGVLASRGSKYIMMNAPESALDEIAEILPGAEAPTVVPLAGRPGAVAVHAVCKESVFWETLERLKRAGASSILLVPIEKMMI
ncbi:MAG: ATP phosphoribosyltransferase [Alphaproteobacteria bacterium]|nr:ATP phosphoribosyltransferase [Alphaproteobacteria bacterium]